LKEKLKVYENILVNLYSFKQRLNFLRMIDFNYEDNHYGKSCVKVAKVIKYPTHHDFKEFIVDIQLYGDFLNSFLIPNNENVIPTDTMKNTVYVLAKQHSMDSPVEFGIDLTSYFLNKFSHLSKVNVEITEIVWNRVVLDDSKEHTHGFVDKQTHNHKCFVSNNKGQEIEIKAGIVNLSILKTKCSSFEKFMIDEYTTLKPASDRIMATKANIFWRYDNTYDLKSIDHNDIYHKVKKLTVETFVQHDDSKSVQHTINIIGSNILNFIKQIQNIEINLPNSHYLLSNIADFGFENDNEIFIPSSEPYGNIFASMSKSVYSIDCFNKLSREKAIEVIKDISKSQKFQTLLVDSRPYLSFKQIIHKVEDINENLNNQDFLDQIISATRISNLNVDSNKLTYIKEECSSLIEKNENDERFQELATYNIEYEKKFKHIFFLSVAGKSLDEIIVSIKKRLKNSVEDELRMCIQELKKVQKERVSAVLKSFGQKIMSEENKFQGVKLH
jgi:urate oxidase